MKSIRQIREASGGKEAYQKFFNSILKKFGVDSPSELKGDKKKDFFDAIDKGWDGDNEKAESVQEAKRGKYKAGKGKSEIKLRQMSGPDAGDELGYRYGDINKKAPNYNIKLKPTKTGAVVTGDKQNILDFLNGDAYAMPIRYIKDLYPELFEGVVQEAKKLSGGKGKAKIDINFMGDKKDAKFAATKYKIGIKVTSNGAILSGDKQKILAYLQGQDYAMDAEDIEDLYPELMETYDDEDDLDPDSTLNADENPLATGKSLGEAFAKSYGYTHTEEAINHLMKSLQPKSALARTISANADNVTREFTKMSKLMGKIMEQWEAVEMVIGMNESVDEAANSSLLKKAQAIASKLSGNMTKAVAEIEKLKKGLSNDKKVMAMLKTANEAVNEMKVDQEVTANIKGKKVRVRIIAIDSDKNPNLAVHVVDLKDPDKDYFVKRKDIKEDMAMCEQCGKMHEEGACGESVDENLRKDIAQMSSKFPEGSKVKMKHDGKIAKVLSVSKDSIKVAVGNKTMEHKPTDLVPVDEAAKVLSKKGDYAFSTYRNKEVDVTYKGKVIATGDFDSGADAWFLDIKGTKGQRSFDSAADVIKFFMKNKITEAVSVDRRTTGFKEALKRRAEAKAKREAMKIKAAKKQSKTDMANIDANYAYDGDIEEILASANKKIMGEDAPANASSSGAVDMNPTGKSKKKDKESLVTRSASLMAKRGY